MITAFIGNDYLLRGNGKTLSMVYYLYQDYKRGRRVITNFYTTFSEQKPLLDITTGVLDTDLQDVSLGFTEIQTVLNSLGTKSNIITFIDEMVSQTRKRNVSIMWDTQRWMNVHIRLREQTDIVIKPFKTHTDKAVCYKDSCNEKHYIFVMSEVPKRYSPLVVLDAEKVGALFDSNQIIREKKTLPSPKS